MKNIIKVIGYNDYYLEYYFNDNGDCFTSCDSDGKIAKHSFDENNKLIQTYYIGNAFIKQWFRRDNKLINYSDSEGVFINFEDLDIPDSLYGYHGTSLEYAQEIKKNGYIKNVDKHWDQSTGNMFIFSNISGLYSEDYCFNMAKKFAKKTSNKYNTIGAICKINILGLETRKYSVDYYDPSYEIISTVGPGRVESIIEI